MHKKMFFALLAALIFFSQTQGSLLKRGQWIYLADTCSVAGDLYIAGQNADVEGTVPGDLLVACQRLDVSGTVGKNLYAAAQNIRIEGEVVEDVWGFAQDIDLRGKSIGTFRGACAQLLVNCPVNGDILVGAGQVFIGPRAVVNGDLFVGAGELAISGVVLGRVKGEVEKVKISGRVVGNVNLGFEELTIDSAGVIEGDLLYKRDNPINTDPIKAQVKGNIIFKKREEPCKLGACWWLGKIWLLASVLLLGIIFIVFFKKTLRENLNAFTSRPWKTLLVGFLGFIIFPVSVIVAIITVIGIPLGVILAMFYGIFLFLAWIISAMLVGKLIMELLGALEPSLYLSLLIGVVILFLLAMIPIVGGLFCILATLFGMGIILYGLQQIFWGDR